MQPKDVELQQLVSHGMKDTFHHCAKRHPFVAVSRSPHDHSTPPGHTESLESHFFASIVNAILQEEIVMISRGASFLNAIRSDREEFIHDH
jgi:hypothetical protein